VEQELALPVAVLVEDQQPRRLDEIEGRQTQGLGERDIVLSLLRMRSGACHRRADLAGPEPDVPPLIAADLGGG
jgi:hypothetical protein